jgi:hypothetical protein
MWTSVGVAVFFSAGPIIAWLAIGGVTAEILLPVVPGWWAGLFLAWAAFRISGWGRSAARPLYLWGIVGGVGGLLMFMGPTIASMFFINGLVFSVGGEVGLLPSPAAIAYYTACGLVLGAASTVTDIAGWLRKEDRSS